MKIRGPIVSSRLFTLFGAMALVTLFQNCDTGFSLQDNNAFTLPSVVEPPSDLALKGQQLFEKNCAACHFDLEKTDKKGRSAQEIDTAIRTVSPMNMLASLSISDINAIVAALAPPPVVVIPNPGGGNPDPGGGNPDPGTGNPDPGGGNPGTGNPDPGTGNPQQPPVVYKYSCVNPTTRGIANTGIRRLTKNEISNSLNDLIGSNIMTRTAVKAAMASIPNETPGDIVKEFQASHAGQHVDGLLNLNEAIADAVLASAADKGRIFGTCANSNLDNNCVTNFINNMGMRILRRPVSDQRRAELMNMYTSANSGDSGLKGLLMSMLLSPEFIFHMEMGRTTCSNILPSPVTIASNNSAVVFDGDGATQVPGKSALTTNGWLVFQIPASSITSAYQQVVVTAHGNAVNGAAPVFSINVNDGPVAQNVQVSAASNEFVYSFNVARNQPLKVGIYYSNGTDGRVLNVSSVTLRATSNDPGGNCQVIVANNGRTVLDDYEIASRISFSVTGSTPDAALLTAAGALQLRTVAGVRTQVERLLGTAGARSRLDAITDAWLVTGAIPDPSPILANAAGISGTGLKDEARRELGDYVNYMILDQEADVKTFMSAKVGFPRTARMAAIYESGIAQGNTPVPLTKGHGGLLLRASVLLSGQVASSPILRGVYVRKRLLCDTLASPDFATVTQRTQELGIIDRTKYNGRQVAEIITAPVACAACHTAINPLGFVLEAFDPLGRARQTETVYNNNGQVIATHNLDLSVVDAFIEANGKKAVNNAQDLLQGIAESSKVRSCISERFYSHARLRSVSNSTDGCALSEVEVALAQGKSVKEALILSIANEDIFWRKAVGGQ